MYSIYFRGVDGESTNPQSGITPPKTNGNSLEQVPGGLRRTYATVVLHIRDGTGEKMAAALHVYKMIRSKLCRRYSHKPLCAIPVILECFHQ